MPALRSVRRPSPATLEMLARIDPRRDWLAMPRICYQATWGPCWRGRGISLPSPHGEGGIHPFTDREVRRGQGVEEDVYSLLLKHNSEDFGLWSDQGGKLPAPSLDSWRRRPSKHPKQEIASTRNQEEHAASQLEIWLGRGLETKEPPTTNLTSSPTRGSLPSAWEGGERCGGRA